MNVQPRQPLTVMDNTPSPQISPASTASALGPEDCSGAVDKRKAQRVAWDAETDVSNMLSQPPLRVADQEGPAAEGADDDVLKQPAQRVPFDGANGATPEDDPEDHDAGAAYDDGDEEADSGSGRLAPATPDLDEELQQSATAAAAAGYVSRENRTPYMERKIRELRANDRQQATDGAADIAEEPQKTPGLGQGLLVHRSRLEVEVEEAARRRTAKQPSYMRPTASSATKTVHSPSSASGSPSPQRASPQRQSPSAAARLSGPAARPGEGLEDVLTVRKSRVERAQEAAEGGRYESVSPAKAAPAEPGLDQVLVKKKSKLELEKEAAAAAPREAAVKKQTPRVEPLEDMLIIKKSLLEIEKEAAAESATHTKIKSPTRSELHKKDQGEAWGNEPLWAVQKPHRSRLELEQEAWRRAEKAEARPPPPRTLRAPLRTPSVAGSTSPSFMRDTASSARKHYSPAPADTVAPASKMMSRSRR